MGNTMVLRLQAQGVEHVQRRLMKLAARGRSLRVPLVRAGAVILKAVDDNIEAEGRPQRWKPRSPFTMAILRSEAMTRTARTKRYQRAKTFATRVKYLRASAAKVTGSGAPRLLAGSFRQSMVMRVDGTRVVVGSTHPGGRIHQVGGVIRPKGAKSLSIPAGDRVFRVKQVTIPARPYLVLQPDDEQKILLVFMDWLREEGG